MTKKAIKKTWTPEKVRPRDVHAARVFTARRDRDEHPDGSTDKGGRWYPSASEKQACCRGIRQPSRDYPWTLMHHCRTADHIAEMWAADAQQIRRISRVISALVGDGTEYKRAAELIVGCNCDLARARLYSRSAISLLWALRTEQEPVRRPDVRSLQRTLRLPAGVLAAYEAAGVRLAEIPALERRNVDRASLQTLGALRADLTAA